MKKILFRECLRIAHSKNNPDDCSEWGNYHHYSFVIQNNKIIEYGMNRKGPVIPGLGYSEEFGKIHSENDAYKKAKGLLNPNKEFAMINIRLNKTGQLRMSKPCSCCMNFLNIVGCSKVYFSTEIGFAKIKI